tara:strand:- start:506 stop:838 length:333 start_codon:yes stop_codon:yes gene_type:complete
MDGIHSTSESSQTLNLKQKQGSSKLPKVEMWRTARGWDPARKKKETRKLESVRIYGPKSKWTASAQHPNPNRHSFFDQNQDPQNRLKSKCGQRPEARISPEKKKKNIWKV